ncbi:MAG: hypothetical protein IMZ52_00325 [Actinobacteria bacterium]|nr:hypothetical protein [Actinomycetota bacterium]
MIDRESIEKMSLYEILGGLKAGIALACGAEQSKEEIIRRLEELYAGVVYTMESHFHYGCLKEE